jgi:ankyrin repeat protein
MFAAQNGHDPCARSLIKARVAVDATEKYGWTALMIAAQNGHEPCARALMDAGARKNVKTKGIVCGLGKRTAASIARAAGHKALYKLLKG